MSFQRSFIPGAYAILAEDGSGSTVTFPSGGEGALRLTDAAALEFDAGAAGAEGVSADLRDECGAGFGFDL